MAGFVREYPLAALDRHGPTGARDDVFVGHCEEHSDEAIQDV